MGGTNEGENEISSPDVVDFDRLEMLLPKLRTEYATAQPWPHVVVDDFLNRSRAIEVSRSFPPFGKLRTQLARIFEARSDVNHPENCNTLAALPIFQTLHSKRFVRFLEALTEIRSLVPDYESIGAGFHQGARGSSLRIHSDHNTHPTNQKLFRRVNLLIYLSENWQEDWDGNLQLWDRGATACQRIIPYSFNRCVILASDDSTYHGYSKLRTPYRTTRKALAAYYYSEVRAEYQKGEAHSTQWPRLVGETLTTELMHRGRKALLVRLERFLGLNSRLPKHK